ncbi:MAG: hypothetical protein AAF196_00975 [Planctomycetota bacterium]
MKLFRHLNLILIGVGLVVGYFAFKESKLLQRTKPVPQEISIADLVADGAGDNLYVRLGDDWVTDGQWVEISSGRRRRTKTTYVGVLSQTSEKGRRLVEAIDRGEDGANASRFDMLLRFRKTSADEVGRELDRGAFEGVVISELESLDSDVIEVFVENGGPNVPEDILVVEVGRKPKSWTFVWSMFGFGGLSVAIGAFRLVLQRQRAKLAAAAQPQEDGDGVGLPPSQ